MAEVVVVNCLVKPAVLRIAGPHQFGTVPNSLTTQVLINTFHQLTCKFYRRQWLSVWPSLTSEKHLIWSTNHLLVRKIQSLDFHLWSSDGQQISFQTAKWLSSETADFALHDGERP